MYVAATRAEEIFIISGSEESDKTENGQPLRKPRYLFARLEEIDANSCGGEGFPNMRWDQVMQPVDNPISLPKDEYRRTENETTEFGNHVVKKQ